MDLREEIRSGLLHYALGKLEETKGSRGWWDALDMDGKKKVAGILGFKMGKKVAFTSLSPSLQSELEAYYVKHKGKIESTL